MRPLKVGVILPIEEGGENRGDPPSAASATRSWRQIAEQARLAEELGFDSVWLVDHLLFRGTSGQSKGIWECWSLLAALAAVTERVELGPLVACAGLRNPALLAKMADTADEISGGRLSLGLGAGWHEPEYRAFGFPYDHLVGRFAEALPIIAGLLRDGRVDSADRYYQARDCELRPRGPRPGGPPLLVGALGTGPRMLELTARYADLWNGWLVWGRSHPGAIPPLRAKIDAACLAAGRDPATLARTVAILVSLDLPEAGPVGEGEEPLTGTPAEIAAAFRGFAREGTGHLQIMLNPNTPAGLRALAPALALLDRPEPSG